MSHTSFISVPFKALGGWARTEGMAKFSGDNVILEYTAKTLESESRFSPTIKSVVKKTSIEFEDILDVKFKRGIFKIGAKIEIRLKSFGKLTETPSKNGKIVLRINRADFERAAEAVTGLQKKLSDFQRLPNAQSPVSLLIGDGED